MQTNGDYELLLRIMDKISTEEEESGRQRTDKLRVIKPDQNMKLITLKSAPNCRRLSRRKSEIRIMWKKA